MHKIIITLALTASLGACGVAKMEVKNSLTERGFVATKDFEIGQVMHWLPDENQLLPIAVIERKPRVANEPANLKVNFEAGVEFKGGVNLTDSDQLDLEGEVASRTSTVLENAITRSLENVTTIVINDWNARPDIWQNELGISDRGWPEGGKPIYVAVVYKQTLANGLTVNVDKNAAAGGEFKSSIKGANGNVKFKIVDTASLEVKAASSNRTPIYYDFEVVRIRNTADGPKFSLVRNSEIRENLAAFIVR